MSKVVYFRMFFIESSIINFSSCFKSNKFVNKSIHVQGLNYLEKKNNPLYHRVAYLKHSQKLSVTYTEGTKTEFYLLPLSPSTVNINCL